MLWKCCTEYASKFGKLNIDQPDWNSSWKHLPGIQVVGCLLLWVIYAGAVVVLSDSAVKNPPVMQDHLMQRTDSLGKTLILGKIEGRRRRGCQRMIWLDGITDFMDVSLTSSGSWFRSVQLLSRVWLFATPWITACKASLSITNSWRSFRLTSIESVMSSSHLILCRPLLLLSPILPSIRVFSNESTLRMRWPKYSTHMKNLKW